jgi:hypothetical protein
MNNFKVVEFENVKNYMNKFVKLYVGDRATILN